MSTLTFDHFVGGRFLAPVGGRYLDVFEPATGKIYARAAAGTAADVDLAVQAAEAAFPAWSQTKVEERARLLIKLADLLEAKLEALAEAESIDQGKPWSLARTTDIPRAIANFRFFGTRILHLQSELFDHESLGFHYTQRRPRGVCGLISPWNLPLYLLTWKIAPAIAYGNTVVAKPSELTPRTAFHFAEICLEAGLPAGVVNIVHGYGRDAGAALVEHPRATTISFTGGTATGAAIAKSAAPLFKKISLELGGKNANVIFADADLRKAVPMAVKAAFTNQGEICLTGSRLLVERKVLDLVTEGVVEGANRLIVGDPLVASTDQGALVSAQHLDKVRGYVALAKQDGGSVLAGGDAPSNLSERCRGGYFLRPTVITGLGPNSRVNQEEIFGPVVSIIPFDSEQHALEIANGTPYGLAATVWTENVARAHRVAARLDAGVVWINCWMVRDLRTPFGGVKHSGVGREGGDEAYRFYTEPKSVTMRVPES
jgi:aminomuconate-semialdehyde/2-hydroxymuconate-6-semialdehyde dehydrogenase